MRLAVLTATTTEDDFYPNLKDLKKIGELRGHTVDLLKNGEFQLLVEPLSTKIFHNGKMFNTADYDVVLNRISVRDKSTADYYLVHEFLRNGVKLFNTPDAIEKARNKLWTLQLMSELNIPLTKSLIVRRQDELSMVNDLFKFPVIVKNIFGSLGSSTLLAYDFAQLKSMFDYLWNINRNEVLLIQEFVRTADLSISDFRVFMLGTEVAAVMQRTNKSGDFRANYSRGAGVEPAKITDQEKEYCQKIMTKFNLQIAGLDFIRTANGPVFLEVNSNPGLDGIRSVTKKCGEDILEKILDYCEKIVK
jgi:ribosomal protein S6--L-glutamate ligase